jgi:glycosyltransferase involved in cell wall biosynthesis
MTKPSVLFVNNYWFPRGGPETYCFNLIDLLEQKGHDTFILSSENPMNRFPAPRHAYVKPINIVNPGLMDIARFVYSRKSASALKVLLRTAVPDIAHLHVYYGNLTSSVLAVLKKADIPVVQSLHDYRLICPVSTMTCNGDICEACGGRDFWHAVMRRCNRGSVARSALSAVESYVSSFSGAVDKIDHFIAVSHFMRSKVIQHGVPPSKVTTIHNFVDASKYEPNHARGDYFIYFGRLELNKGIFTLLEAAAGLTGVPLYIVGDGREKGRLEEIISKRNLAHIKLLGHKRGEDLHRLIRNSICSILPSEWYENCPMSVLESHAFGRPVIATRIGGTPELISEGVDGFLVPSGDSLALRERMQWMAEHRGEAVEMGRAGRVKVETRFSPEIHYEGIMKVYRGLL